LKRLYFTVTNDLTYDQRMHRICGSLAAAGYDVALIGRKRKNSLPLQEKSFRQHRIPCWFDQGKLFYIEYNIRLFFYLLFKKMDGICAIDLDTILPVLYISRLKKIPRVYDAHELFTELKEVISRPFIHQFWLGVEQKAVPKFKWGYTVSESIAEEFHRRYKVEYRAIRNVPVLQMDINPVAAEKIIVYVGAVNEARGFEYLVPAMQWVNAKLLICGDGNFMEQLKKLILDFKLQDKVELTGMLSPEALRAIAPKAYIGVAVPEKEGLNQYLALPNKFFDYIHAGLPQLTVDYPEYRKLNKKWEVAVLISDLAPKRIAAALNNLLDDTVLYERLRQNCLKARESLNWQEEEKKLIAFYQTLFDA
jgi:glycosyltransferase involved in cell wall biosynthesis